MAKRWTMVRCDECGTTRLMHSRPDALTRRCQVCGSSSATSIEDESKAGCLLAAIVLLLGTIGLVAGGYL